MRFPVIVLASLALSAPMMSVAASGPSHPEPKEEVTTAVRGPIVGIVTMVDYDEQYAIQEEQAIQAYLAAVENQRRVDAYLAELAAAEQARQAAEAEAQRKYQGSQRAPALNNTTVGDCTGFAIPDYIIQRESGGNPSAMNPSGAYGCAQTLLSHYSSGSCRGLDPYTIEGQRACVDILSNGGTNLSPWAQTR
jgi:hypothetical protein